MGMKLLLAVIVLALSPQGFSQDEELLQDAITKPSFSIRCRELHRERSQKIETQQRLQGLLNRNEALTRRAPQTREGMKARLEANRIRIKNELQLTNLQVEAMEEKIVRSGCPGISLQ
jgi:hypothetical protein